ncbi:MAG: hypothetical protein A2Y57_00725 [Candidatus Woykebacteria bacterium RBG_13_40_7b]|uniref:Transcriptional repressor PaaX-like central Cas2-like domain-containing protein n=1 Tax=Candidatus Woykebacteria bacterium RBG_13_40_7b TaxID=1802594 RepID=A0A1G1WAI7_9BACT|nr:MAG: hypothetical protein A2Y57_00725 [Candidatus Woykebacteria bacterium RBG_13_40_7b]
MPRKTFTEKVLILLDGLIKEQAAFMYPYKGFGKKFKKYEGSFSQAIYELQKRGYLEKIEEDGEKYLKLTSKGHLRLIKKKIFRQWDGYWRIIAFDISEKRKKTRDVFRSKLSELNCKHIQKSVWITPSNISVELQELIELLSLKENVDYFISKALTNEEKYLKMFKIKNIDKK